MTSNSVSLAAPPHDWSANPVAQLRFLSSFQPSRDESLIPQIPSRPLGGYSDKIATELGEMNEYCRNGGLTPTDLCRLLEESLAAVDSDVVDSWFAGPVCEQLHTARLDLVFGERAIAIAYAQAEARRLGIEIEQGEGEFENPWKQMREDSALFKLARAYSAKEGSHPFLSWSDIASRHPPTDPRPFLPPGRGQDQEVLMYRVQGGIDRAYRALLESWPAQSPTAVELESYWETSDAVAKAMAQLSKVREVGEFYKLDPYLGPNNEVRGHGTGAFSAWTFLVGYLITGKGDFYSRFTTPENRMAFDSDSHPFIDQIVRGQLVPLGADDPETTELVADVRERYTGFHLAHKGAMAKHAPTSFKFDAPANPQMSNAESVRLATDLKRRGTRSTRRESVIREHSELLPPLLIDNIDDGAGNTPAARKEDPPLQAG